MWNYMDYRNISLSGTRNSHNYAIFATHSITNTLDNWTLGHSLCTNIRNYFWTQKVAHFSFLNQWSGKMLLFCSFSFSPFLWRNSASAIKACFLRAAIFSENWGFIAKWYQLLYISSLISFIGAKVFNHKEGLLFYFLPFLPKFEREKEKKANVALRQPLLKVKSTPILLNL